MQTKSCTFDTVLFDRFLTYTRKIIDPESALNLIVVHSNFFTFRLASCFLSNKKQLIRFRSFFMFLHILPWKNPLCHTSLDTLDVSRNNCYLAITCVDNYIDNC